jgi:hypothetical protein
MLTLAAAAGLGVCSSAFADIKGTVSFEGNAPEPEQIDMSAVKECAMQHPDGAFDQSLVVADGKLANVIISVKEAPAGGQAPTAPAVLDQKGCQYSPHVMAVMVGQPISVRNDDPFLHNVHSLAIDNPAFNFGQPNVDPGKKVDPMKVAERFKIKCDVHPWMSAHVSVFEHPFFAVSKEDGTFTIPGEVAGDEVTLVAWHEKLGEQEIKVKVSGGKAENANFTFKAAGADAGKQLNNPATADVKLASFQAKADPKAAATKACCENCPTSKAAALKAVAETKPKAEQPQASAK